ncbi:MAG TPA: DUF4173 domain-containing protein [Patescibacteria group bacterium]|nr:DUF4173 domain-containing protein [Patescibacteria group bacterium]
MESLRTYSMRYSLGVFFSALALTLVFHFFFGFGFSFVVFVLLAVIAMHVIVALSGGAENRWAYLFLVPVLFGLITNFFFSSMALESVSFLLTFGSLALFAYWITAPRVSFARLPSFWPLSFFGETIFPFPELRSLFAGKTVGAKAARIALGVLIAIPVLLIVFALFASADPLFHQSINTLLTVQNLQRYVFQIIRDVIVGFCFLGFGWTMLTRGLEKREPTARERTWDFSKDHLILHSFLAVLNIAFLIFVGFQMVYFFGGAGVIASRGITYASYAREGFFQLLFVAGIVFLISWFVYWLFGMKEIWNRLLLTGLVAETGIILLSALRRLTLYVGAYGLSVSRVWAYVVLILVALVLVAAIVFSWIRFPYQRTAKMLFLGVVFLISVLCLFNVDAFVVRWNANRFLTGKTDTLDINYLTSLSSDAVPALVQLANQKWPETDGNGKSTPSDFLGEQQLKIILQTQRQNLENDRKHGWRGLSWSTFRALDALRLIQ